MFKRLKNNAKNKHKTTNGHRHYGAFGHTMIMPLAQKHKTSHLIVTENTKEHQLARELSYQMHQALDTMHHQLSRREKHMEERFITLSLEKNAAVAPSKRKKGVFVIGGILAAVIMIFLLQIMQNMQTSMTSMSGDINGMTQDITQMSTNTKSMSNNMQMMNQNVSGMNQQIGTISESIEPMGDIAQNVSPFATMFNQLSPF